MQAFTGHSDVVTTVAWSPSGELLLSGGDDGSIRWWNVKSEECIRAQEAHQGAVKELKVSPDGSRFATCGDDGVIQIWDLHSGKILRTLRRDRPYERLNITDVIGLSEAQKASLCVLGAFEETSVGGNDMLVSTTYG
jgi:WD40 repeat protein